MYRCGMYLRTSKNVKDESNSIEMQENIISKFVKQYTDIQIKNIYVDDGYSGLDFIRPGFCSLMKDIEKGVIDCVIVKDLSRLGRDYIQTGMYVQYVLPQKGVRLISINDRYDSINASEIDKYFMVPFRNYINDAYSRDISVKVRSSLYMKMSKGECVISKVPYGYLKKDGKYIVNDEVKEIIKSIFRYALEGYSLQGVAHSLNERNIMTPYEYRLYIGDGYTTSFVDRNRKKSKYCWYPMMVKRILTDKVYIGALVQGKVEKYSYKIKKRNYKEEEMWYCKYNHHEKIVNEKMFFVVNYILKLDVRRQKKEVKCSEFSGIVRCGICNKSLYNKQYKYICNRCDGKYYTLIKNSWKHVNSIKGKLSNKIGISKELLRNMIYRIIELIEDKDKLIQDVNYTVDRCRIAMNIKVMYIYSDCIGVKLYYE